VPNLDNPAPQPVRPATQADRDAVVRALSAAFYDDPLMRWVFPRDSRRLAALRRIHQMETDAFMDAGLVFLSANQQAAATWLPPGAKESVGPLTVLRNLPTWAAASNPVRAFHALRALAMTEAKRPQQPHYYLGSVGAHPDFQGQGLGSALLDEMMPRIDEEGVPSYLLSSNARNLPLYQRYGYRILEELQIPHDGPVVWPMLRDAVG
jgi:ribosomal protein S18 acetylase RimI-like enzyme